MFLKVLIGCYLILIATAWFNKKIIDTQDFEDDQSWHWYQLLQWIMIYGAILWISGEFLLMGGFALTYPFLYDGLLNLFRHKQWFYEGEEGFGKSFMIPKKIKILLFGLGLIILTEVIIC